MDTVAEVLVVAKTGKIIGFTSQRRSQANDIVIAHLLWLLIRALSRLSLWGTYSARSDVHGSDRGREDSCGESDGLHVVVEEYVEDPCGY